MRPTEKMGGTGVQVAGLGFDGSGYGGGCGYCYGLMFRWSVERLSSD